MPRLIALKLLRLAPVLLLVTVGTFSLLELVPGDPVVAVLGDDFDQKAYDRVYEALNLGDPLWQRYLSWLGGALTGDLGVRLDNSAVTVTEGIQQHPAHYLGVVAGYDRVGAGHLPSQWESMLPIIREGAFDKSASGAAFAIISVPSFLAALLLILLLVFESDFVRYPIVALLVLWAGWLLYRWLASLIDAEQEAGALRLVAGLLVAGLAVWLFMAWPSFPRAGWVRLTSDEGLRENLRHVFLPALALSLTEIAIFTRLLRSDMITSLQEDYVLAARAKGLSNRRILYRHALRPSSFSLITLSGVAFGRLIGGTVIIETIFGLPGMGDFLVEDGINAKDYNVVLGGVLVLATAFVVLNTGVDIAYNYLDPRIRRGRR